MVLSIFSSTNWPFEYLLWKTVYSGPCPLFKLDYLLFLLLLSSTSSFYILSISPLADTRFANMFFSFPPIGGLLTLLMVSFAVQKLLGLI